MAGLSLSGRLRAVLSHLPENGDPQDRAVLTEACNRFEQIESHSADFSVETAVSSSTCEPKLNIVFRGMPAQISVEEGRLMGLGLIAAAIEAMQDSYLVRFLLSGCDFDAKAAAAMLNDFRAFKDTAIDELLARESNDDASSPNTDGTVQ